MAKPAILHMISPEQHVSPFDVNMAADAGFEVIATYGGVELKQVTGLVQDMIFSRASKDGKRTALFIGGRAYRTLGDLMEAEQRATAATLMNKRCPVRTFRVPRLDERALGALFMHFMIETILVGYTLGIDPFDQPAVEDGKILARKYLSDLAKAGVQ